MTGGAGARTPRDAPVRGIALAALTALLTAAGHVAGGGTLPDLALLIVLLPLLAGVFVAVAQRRRNLAGTVVTLGLGQLALHELMTLLHPVHTAVDAPVPSDAAMLGAHAAVTLVVAVAVRHADAAWDAVLAAIGRLVPRRLRPLPARRPLRPLVAADHGVVAALARELAVAQVRRGPPVGC